MRGVLDGDGFVEVETPVLQPLYGGGAAKPFVTFYNEFERDFYLRIADELYLKRLIVGGLERVYEIGKDFRNESVSFKRNPEFSMLEWYEAYADYEGGMERTERVVAAAGAAARDRDRPDAAVAAGAAAAGDPRSDRHRPDGRPRPRPAGGVHARARASTPRAMRPGRRRSTTCSRTSSSRTSSGRRSSSTTRSSCRRSRSARPPMPGMVERFEAFCLGMEIANGYSELNDPAEQRARFEEARAAAAAGDEEAHPMDEDFLLALEYGMPPTCGVGIGVDRLAMVLTGVRSIREVILFPTLRERG